MWADLVLITADLITAPQRTSRSSSTLRSKDYTGSPSRYVILIAVIMIRSPSLFVGLQRRLECPECTNQGCDGGVKQVPVFFESFRYWKQCYREGVTNSLKPGVRVTKELYKPGRNWTPTTLSTTIYTTFGLVSPFYVIISCPPLCTTSPVCHEARWIRYITPF